MFWSGLSDCTSFILAALGYQIPHDIHFWVTLATRQRLSFFVFASCTLVSQNMYIFDAHWTPISCRFGTHGYNSVWILNLWLESPQKTSRWERKHLLVESGSADLLSAPVGVALEISYCRQRIRLDDLWRSLTTLWNPQLPPRLSSHLEVTSK